MYYCQTRYFVPEWGRWLNTDNPSFLQFDNINGMNLFAYCNNNPIMFSDPTGEAVLIFLLGAIIGGAVSFTSSVVTQAIFNEGKVNWSVAAVDGLFGAISGALWMVPGLGAVATGLINAGLTAVNGVITTGMENSWQYTLSDAITIGTASIISGLVSGIGRKNFLRGNGQEILNKSHQLVGAISEKIMSGYYNNSANIFSSSFRSAAGQMFKSLWSLNFGNGFYKDWLLTGLQSVFATAFSRGINNFKW